MPLPAASTLATITAPEHTQSQCISIPHRRNDGGSPAHKTFFSRRIKVKVKVKRHNIIRQPISPIPSSNPISSSLPLPTQHATASHHHDHKEAKRPSPSIPAAVAREIHVVRQSPTRIPMPLDRSQTTRIPSEARLAVASAIAEPPLSSLASSRVPEEERDDGEGRRNVEMERKDGPFAQPEVLSFLQNFPQWNYEDPDPIPVTATMTSKPRVKKKLPSIPIPPDRKPPTTYAKQAYSLRTKAMDSQGKISRPIVVPDTSMDRCVLPQSSPSPNNIALAHQHHPASLLDQDPTVRRNLRPQLVRPRYHGELVPLAPDDPGIGHRRTESSVSGYPITYPQAEQTRHIYPHPGCGQGLQSSAYALPPSSMQYQNHVLPPFQIQSPYPYPYPFPIPPPQHQQHIHRQHQQQQQQQHQHHQNLLPAPPHLHQSYSPHFHLPPHEPYHPNPRPTQLHPSSHPQRPYGSPYTSSLSSQHPSESYAHSPHPLPPPVATTGRQPHPVAAGATETQSQRTESRSTVLGGRGGAVGGYSKTGAGAGGGGQGRGRPTSVNVSVNGNRTLPLTGDVKLGGLGPNVGGKEYTEK
ncbi:hypothetical protein HKX48_001970, partial [Thoreauomyces humboldtii]